MQLCTTSETLSFIKDHERSLIDMYNRISERFPQYNANGLLAASAKEIKGYIQELDRSYYSVITDALEGCFGFDLTAEKYSIDADTPDGLSGESCLQKAIAVETIMLALYEEAATQSGPLLADVPRSMRIIQRKRTKRLEGIKALIQAPQG